MLCPLKDLGRKMHGQEETQGASQLWRAGRNFCSYLWGHTEVSAVWLGSFPEE